MYGATVAIVSLPAVVVGLIGSFLVYAGEYAASDYQSTQYKQMLKSLLLQLGGSPLAVLDELPLLEDSVLLQFSLLYQTCDLTWCTSEAILAAIEEGVKHEHPLSIQLKKFLLDCPIFLDKLRHVGRIHAIRSILENSIMIGFTGVHNAGKSTTIKHLFGVETGADIVVRTEEPVPHALGQWMNKCAEKHPVFEQWLSCTQPSQHQREFQLYAVDFPGTTDERLSVGTITKYTAELASMFVVMLKAGHIAGPEKEVVNVAKANHKPFLVVINQCDTIAHELSKPSNFERIKDSYAKVLDIPEQQLLFVSAFDPTHVDRLRGFIFATIRNLMGNPSDYRTLPLQFIPDKIARELDVRYPEPTSIFNIADRLSEAATSLLCNFSPMTAESLGERALLFNQNVINAMQAAKDSLESGGAAGVGLNNKDAVDAGVGQGLGSILNGLRQLAVVLNIETDVYGALVDVITVTFDFVSESLENANDAQLGAGEENKEAVKATIIALVTLMAVHSRINSYFGGNQPAASPSDKIDKLCREVLLGMNSIFATWLSRGYRSDAIRATIKTILTDNGGSNAAFDDSAFLHSLTEVTSALDMQNAFLHGTSSADAASIEDDLAMIKLSFQGARPTLERSVSTAARLSCLAEVNSYQRAKDFVKQLRAMSFATFPSHSALQLNEACSEDIAEFQTKLGVLVKRHNVAEVMEVPAESFAVNMIEKLKFLTAEQFERCDLKFRITGEAAIDMNGDSFSYIAFYPLLFLFLYLGVTCSLLTKAAAEINEHPEILMMRKDSDSGLLYFDPAACCSNDPVIIAKARECYMGLGRLVGLSLRKSFAGATFPIAFPITVYKCLLGQQIGLADLQIISPQVSNTIHQICTMEGSDLEASDLFFSISLPAPEGSSTAHGPKDIELEPSGRFRQVTLDNRIDYLHQLLKVYLCAKSPASGPALGGLHGATATLLLTDFLLGVQHLCPRDTFNKLSPVTLQLIVEGNAAMDVDEWQAHTEVRSDSSDGLETAALFWKVLKEMDTTDRKRLLCFAVGTASLPAKGFADLSPKFSLNIGGSLSEEALPVSHTCFHMLCLPRYKSEEVMRDKLLQAIRETDVASLGII